MKDNENHKNLMWIHFPVFLMLSLDKACTKSHLFGWSDWNDAAVPKVSGLKMM